MNEEARLMVRPRIARPSADAGNGNFEAALLGYDIVAVTPSETITIVGENGILADGDKHLEIAAGFAAFPVLIGAVEEAISQIEHMAHQLGVPQGTGTSNATIDTLRKALALTQTPRFSFKHEDDEEIMRSKMEEQASPGYSR